MTQTALPADQRQMLVRSFEIWLDRYLLPALDDEAEAQGLAAELAAALESGGPLPSIESDGAMGGCDLYSMFQAMTALSTEVRLQGRSFKALHESVDESLRVLDTMAHGAQQEAEQSSSASTPREEEVRVLIDLRDRMEQGQQAISEAALEFEVENLPFFVRYLGLGRDKFEHGSAVLGALAHGYALTRARIDEALLAMNVLRIHSMGACFDPSVMTAIESDVSGNAPDGTVVEVFREGYEWNGEIYRSAQVKVAIATKEITGADPTGTDDARQDASPDVV